MTPANRMTFTVEDGVKKELEKMARKRFLKLNTMLNVWVIERMSEEKRKAAKE